MLRAEDFRIGNLVYNKHGECHEIGYNCFQRFRHPAMDNNPSGFIPIDLTEDILLKCGFVQDLINRQGKLILLLNIKNRNGYEEYLYCNDDLVVKSYSIRDIQIKYLHQLQNLYFALTGNELEVSL